MKKIAGILLVVGGVLLIFSPVITFKTDLPEPIDDIIYFRLILLGSCIVFTSIPFLIKKVIIQNIFSGLAFGQFGLIIVSTHNLICDSITDLDLYFDFTMYLSLISIITITLIRLCWNRASPFLKRL